MCRSPAECDCPHIIDIQQHILYVLNYWIGRVKVGYFLDTAKGVCEYCDVPGLYHVDVLKGFKNSHKFRGEVRSGISNAL